MAAYVTAMVIETPFIHVFQEGNANLHPLLLLHGTGGNEQDLLSLAATVAPGRSLLSPRGRVLENGMPRFFRRFAEGKFDEDDVRLRAGELAAFVVAAQRHYDLKSPIALGFSNGANIAAALLVLHPKLLAGAVLLRAMAPFKDMPAADLRDVSVLLSSGATDTMIPTLDSDRLADDLKTSGATLTHKTLPTGHGLIPQDITAMTEFLRTQD
jgi:phospholipase/carboxylesterase